MDRGKKTCRQKPHFPVTSVVCNKIAVDCGPGYEIHLGWEPRNKELVLYFSLCLHFMSASQVPRDELSFPKSLASIPQIKLNSDKGL